MGVLAGLSVGNLGSGLSGCCLPAAGHSVGMVADEPSPSGKRHLFNAELVS